MMSGEVRDYQVSAWLMAVCIQGMTLDETVSLTRAFVDSGTVLDWSDIDGVVVDKHSTGGVGDKTTLVLAPLLAAADLKVAKLSGRGLGFTGGTIDKLEAIPGFRTQLSNEAFRQQLQSVGVVVCSQTADLAPADGKMYALRDVTATVDNIPLIAASVVSKKIASGAQVIVLDIKAGCGAFMKTEAEARALADCCRAIGRALGRQVETVISSMESPLGLAVGHTLEVAEAVRTLQGEGPADLEALCLRLGAVALTEAGGAADLKAAEARLKTLLNNGQAFEKFVAMAAAQGGDVSVLRNPDLLQKAPQQISVPSPEAGYVHGIDALKVAEAAKVLGAGRPNKETPIDLTVGVVLNKTLGDVVLEGEPLATLHVRDKGLDAAQRAILEAFSLSSNPLTEQAPLILTF
jgi:pyrimidine-nucleoside phosphorylase